jgi:hypothetical protein
VGIPVGTRWPNRPRMETGSSTRPPLQLCLALISPKLQGVSVVSEVTGMSQLLRVLQLPLFSSAAGFATATMARPSSSGAIDAERSPRPRKSTLGPPSGVLSVWRYSYSCSYSKRWCCGDRSRTSLSPIIHRPAVCPVMPPYLTSVASLSRGTPGPDGASLGAISIKADGASPQPGGDTGRLLLD